MNGFVCLSVLLFGTVFEVRLHLESWIGSSVLPMIETKSEREMESGMRGYEFS